ncbi:MAG: response regulator [Deltaproteobacteria bacterium]|nr:response regulator [Deltaproteobacteria bacterium]
MTGRKGERQAHSIGDWKEGEALERKKILVVDDAEFNRDLIVQLLSDDYDILLAVDGAEGVDKAEQERPDLILMDLGMPVMDGWEATRIIKANGELKHIPVIAVTSHAMVGDEIQARQAGCDAYVPKPIDEEELIRKVKHFLQ